ncbi:central kinetochore-associated-domain-containing protein [Aspergillus oleicola]
MSNPLSPLTISRQNSRTVSSDLENAHAKGGGIDRLLAANTESENPLLSPKQFGDGERRNIRQNFGYDTGGYDAQGQETDNEDEVSLNLQSSPFRVDARDDTVDMQMLQQYQVSRDVSEPSTTPLKRSYDQVPDLDDTENGQDSRFKRSTGRGDAPEISIYADEDSGYNHDQSINDAVKQDTGNSMVEERQHEGMSTVLREHSQESWKSRGNTNIDDTNDTTIDDDAHDPMDDTCFSTFSAVPNVDMTAFANLRGGSPFKNPRPLPDFPVESEDLKREATEPATPATAKKSPRKNVLLDMSSPRGSPTPRKREHRESEGQAPNETPNLLDFTDQIELYPRRQRYIQQHERYSPSRRSPLRNPRKSLRSPAKMSLLDFDIPSIPTPRSLPSVTPRELESLKSGFLSEISSLKATLSGKEAEVSSLKKAVSDAERRVGEALEEVRNEAARKETLEIEQAEWQRRGREMEDVLRSVRAEILEGDQERERLQKKNEESEKAKEQAESRIVELESQLTAARKSAVCEHRASGSSASSPKTAEETAKEIQDAVEKVARDLHTLYKEKHETKVAALKKSYESRWEKRLREAEKKLKAANDECERVKTESESVKAERDAALQETTRPDASMIARESEEHEAEKHVLEAQITGLQQEIASLKDDSEQLRVELKAERAEKGDLVALVEEWLSMQNQPAPSSSEPKNEESTPEPVSHEQLQPAEDLEPGYTRSSSSGLRAPNARSSSSSHQPERKIPRIGAPASRHGRGNSGGNSKSGIAVFTPGRSGIMGSIERMGRGGSA